MNPDDQQKLGVILVVILPTLFWLQAVKKTEVLTEPKWQALWHLLKHTHEKPLLLAAAIGGLVLALLLLWMMTQFSKLEFEGAYFGKFLRGTSIVSSSKLKRITKEKQQQVTIAGIPMPTKVENLHLLVGGSTGAGKSVLIRELVYKALLRGDRMIVADPDGDMLAKFWKEGDIILNPYDIRTQGWSFFNEIRNDYDFKRYVLSIVPRGQTEEAEEWAGYARLLLRETARKLQLIGNPSMRDLFRWTTIASPDELKEFLTGTDAESLFVGAPRALASARFVLSDKLPEHVNMPAGNFSLRGWLENLNGGNLYITWREDMTESLKPLISAWVDVLCTSILTLPDDENRRLWMVLDELASLEKLASLESALTKGRKKGLRVVAGLQSTAQLEDVYGEKEAQTLKSCFRSLVVLGGAKTDPKTCEDMSKSLGEHEVERMRYSKSSSAKSTSTNTSIERATEKVVMPSQIATLPELTGYVAYAGNRPISKVTIDVLKFVNRTANFQERST